MRDKDFYLRQFGTWAEFLLPIIGSDRFEKLLEEAKALFGSKQTYPSQGKVFQPFRSAPYNKTDTIIICEKPFSELYSTGLALAENDEAFPIDKHLMSFMKCIEEEFYDGFNLNPDYSLQRYANQGVLFLNMSLSTSMVRPANHAKIWHPFTRTVIKRIAKQHIGKAFVLIGPNTHVLEAEIKNTGNYIYKVESTATAANEVRPLKCPLIEINNSIKHKINW